MPQHTPPRSLDELKERLSKNAAAMPTSGKSAQIMRPRRDKQPPLDVKKLDLEELQVPQWKGTLERADAPVMLKKIQRHILPWLEISEKLLAHTHMQAQAITLLQRKGDAEATVKKLTKRVASVIALKEDVDDLLSQECTLVLEAIEAAHTERENDAD